MILGPVMMMTVRMDPEASATHVARVEAAYRRFHPQLWRSLFATCRDRDQASDAEAEAWAQALRRGDGIEDVDRWVWKSALRILDGLMADHPPGSVLPDTVGPEAGATDFLDLVGVLSPQQRQIVVLRYVAQFKPSEIAGVIDSTPGSVRVQLHRAHASLRSLLSEQEN